MSETSGSRSALPPGFDWTPVDIALAHLRQAIMPVDGTEFIGLASLSGRVLAENVTAARSSPPVNNSAVDGWGFQYAASGEGRLRLQAGRVAAGDSAATPVLPGNAVRILTGAPLPPGVDTVVLSESANVEGGWVRFARPRKQGANTRLAGEDLREGFELYRAGRVLAVRDIASLAAAGHAGAVVRRRPRIAVGSTGNELCGPAEALAPWQICDANLPMLISLVREWGFEAVDLGRARDDPGEIRSMLDAGASVADALLLSGGASSGDEDHVSRLLAGEGEAHLWRIAVKPGRPLSFAKWKGKIAFGLPGNPVAAFVCTLLFAHPALHFLAGAGWVTPPGHEVPAAFAKQKLAGRREFIRARLNADNHAEAFRSEGSGLTTGLAWSTGLVELGDGACTITPGSPVRFIPYSSFGIRNS